MSRRLAVVLVTGILPAVPLASAAGPARDLRKLDVCATVPGAEVARLAGGQLVESKPFNAPDGKLARCLYFVAPPGKSAAKAAWVVELFPPEDFDGLRPHIEEPVRDVAGLGDGGYEYKDAGSGRWRLYTHRRGDVTVSVTGTDEAIVRRIAAFALSRP
jgi:hypothetical protein